MPRAKKTPAAPPRAKPGRKPRGLHPKLLRLDDPAIAGMCEYSADYDVDHSEAVRELLAAYCQSPEVRAAVLAWRQARTP